MPKLAEEFSEQYRKLESGELLALALQRQQLEPRALIALNSELAARNLGEKDLSEFEEQLRREPEQQAEDIEEEELPPPIELPDDWFDEETDSSPASLASSRPKGVTAGAFMFWFSGIIGTGSGTWIILEGESPMLWVIGSIVVALGVLSFIAGSGLWKLNPSARTLAEVLCWAGIMWDGASIVVAAILRLRGSAINPWTIIYQFIGVLWKSLWVIYLRREDIRQIFVGMPHDRQTTQG